MRSQPALAERAGISARKVSDVERGEFAGVKTYNAIEQVFGWPRDSMQGFLDGGPEPRGLPRETPHEWSASERAKMRDMSMVQVQETFEIFRRRSEHLADLWMREVLRVKAEAETAARTSERTTTDG